MRTTLVNQMISRVMTISVVMTGSQTVWVPWTLLAVPVSLSLKIRVVTRHRDYQNYSRERALAGWLTGVSVVGVCWLVGVCSHAPKCVWVQCLVRACMGGTLLTFLTLMSLSQLFLLSL